MDAERWSEIQAVFADALALEGDARREYLDRACGRDGALRGRVEALLAAAAAADDFLDAPALPSELVDAQDANEGRTIGAYVLDRRIGSGGMGSVYLAHRADQQFEQRVAVKMLRRGLDTDLLVRRFRHERQILASLNHPNIARLFDGGSTDDGLPYFVMELVDGQAIDAYANEKRLTTTERLRLCFPIIDAVQHAHERQVIHRDLKPSNVLVTSAGHPTLLDFGIAKVLDADGERTSTLTALARPMTPDYASPEQVRGEPATPATDVYAMGLLLYELLTGHRAYQLTTRTPEEIARVVCELEPARPSAVVFRSDTITRPDGTTRQVTPATVSGTRDGTPERLGQLLARGPDDIVMKALRKDARYRYSSMRALGDDLRRYLDERPVAARRGAWRYSASRLASRHRVAIASVALVVVTAGATVGIVRGRRVPAPAAVRTPESAPRVSPRRSVAVVAFRNLAGAPADAWLSTALAEMLSTELAGGGQLRVVPTDLVSRIEREQRATGVVDAWPSAQVDALRKAAGADVVALGSFTVIPSGAGRALRLDVRLTGTDGAEATAVARSGGEEDLFALVSQVGRALRERFQVEDPSAVVTSGVRAALPVSLEATRLYAEGLDRLRALDGVAARERLERAGALEPDNSLIQSALSTAWTTLGYDGRALEAAQRAFNTSKALTREDRLNIEGRLYEAQRKWTDAVATYRTLWGFFSDNAEYGLRLAAAQTGAGQAKAALATIDQLRQLPTPQNADPRIDLAEASAALALGEFPRESEALRRSAERASAIGATQVRARALRMLGQAFSTQGQTPQAVAAAEQAIAAFDAAGDLAGAALSKNMLGSIVKNTGDTVRAERLQREALTTMESVGDRRGLSMALNSLGVLLKDQGRLAEALAVHQRALAVRREIGDRDLASTSLNNIGVTLLEQDRFREADGTFAEALTISRELDNKRDIVRLLHNRGIIQREVGNLAAARAAYEESLSVRAALNDRRGGVVGRVELGMVQLAQGEIGAARKTLQEALSIARNISLTDGEGHSLYQLAEVALARGDLAESRKLHEAALVIRDKRRDGRTIVESQNALATVSLAEKNESEAIRVATVAERASQEVPSERARAQMVLSRAHSAARDMPAARRRAAQARTLMKATERIWTRWQLEVTDARLELALGQVAAARMRLQKTLEMLQPTGMKLAILETRLLLAECALRQNPLVAVRDLDQVESEARALDAGLIRAEASRLRESMRRTIADVAGPGKG